MRTEFTKCSPPLHFSLEQNHPVVLGCTWWCHKGPGPKWEPQQLHSRMKNHQQDDHALGWPAAGRGRCQPMLPHPHHFNSRGTVGQQPPYGETAMFLVSYRVTASPGPAGDLQLAWGMLCPTPTCCLWKTTCQSATEAVFPVFSSLLHFRDIVPPWGPGRRPRLPTCH